MVVFVIMLALSFFTVLYYPTHLAWWALIIAFIIAFVWMVPLGMVQAITNIQIGLNVITEFIIGYMQPGRPLAMMSFNLWVANINANEMDAGSCWFSAP